MSQPERPDFEMIVRVARASGLETEVVFECIERRVLLHPEEAAPSEPDRWEEEAVAQLLRVRRLRALGVNMQGVEVISHMRRRLIAMREARDELERELEELRAR